MNSSPRLLLGNFDGGKNEIVLINTSPNHSRNTIPEINTRKINEIVYSRSFQNAQTVHLCNTRTRFQCGMRLCVRGEVSKTDFCLNSEDPWGVRGWRPGCGCQCEAPKIFGKSLWTAQFWEGGLYPPQGGPAPGWGGEGLQNSLVQDEAVAMESRIATLAVDCE